MSHSSDFDGSHRRFTTHSLVLCLWLREPSWTGSLSTAQTLEKLPEPLKHIQMPRIHMSKLRAVGCCRYEAALEKANLASAALRNGSEQSISRPAVADSSVTSSMPTPASMQVDGAGASPAADEGDTEEDAELQQMFMRARRAAQVG